MSLTVATWNINSVRLRIANVARFLKLRKPDVLCLQETKCPDEFFPHQAFEELGYRHRLVQGMKAYNGVAILSKVPFTAMNVHHRCAARARRMEPQAAPEDRLAHAGRGRSVRPHDGGDGLDRRAAPFRARGRKTLFVVELPQQRLAQVQSRPAARPYPGEPRAGR